MKRLPSKCFLFVGVVFLFCATARADNVPEGNEMQPLFTKTGGFEMDYMFSYPEFDGCGDFPTGKIIREAIVAKVESCPLTPEAKEKFYKKIVKLSNDVFSIYMTFFATHSFSTFVQNINARCDDKRNKAATDLIRERVAQYNAGKIKLTDVLIDVKNKNSIGEPIDCAEGAKGGFEDMTSAPSVPTVSGSVSNSRNFNLPDNQH